MVGCLTTAMTTTTHRITTDVDLTRPQGDIFIFGYDTANTMFTFLDVLLSPYDHYGHIFVTEKPRRQLIKFLKSSVKHIF